jgi:3-isopropylmalate/(R)-2-methylmalate dehydratase small subunit
MGNTAHKFGDDINTDYIIPGRRRAQVTRLSDLVPYLMEDIRPGFSELLSPGDFIVGGRNFGCGSSREHAPQLLKDAGVSAVLATSFARIFFRNAINLGLPAVVCDTSRISDGDRLEVDLERGQVRNLSTGDALHVSPLPPIMARILKAGGLLPYVREYGLEEDGPSVAGEKEMTE